MSEQFIEAPIFLLQISTIVIPEDRQRDKAEADTGLVTSIQQSGLINPIIVREGNILVAGERRLDAFRKLDRLEIPARNFEDLSNEHAMLIELQENLQRKQLSWQEEARAVYNYHALKTAGFPGWTQLGTANDLGMSDTQVSVRLIVAAELASPEVASCQTLTAAHNFITGRAARAIAAAQARGHKFINAIGKAFDPAAPVSKEDLTASLVAEARGEAPAVLSTTATASLIEAGKRAAEMLAEDKKNTPAELLPSGPILCANFLEWAADYSDVPFDVIHCDFPYGKGYAGANTTTMSEQMTPVYDDSPEVMFELLEGFLSHQSRIVAPQAHLIFWHDRLHEDAIIDMFTLKGWKHLSPYPLIWTKGNSGAPGAYATQFRHCYEQAHFFSLGNRSLVKMGIQDHFPCPVDENKLHLSQKPVSMLRHFLSAVCDEHTRLLDPTCGSGSAIAAANLLGVDYALGLEMDENNAEIARFFVERRTAEGNNGE